MNSIENDNYWNESELSTFNFEQEDSKPNDPFLLEDVIDTSSNKFSEETFVHSFFGFNFNIQIESVSNYLSEQTVNCILEFENEKNELSSYYNLPVDEEIRLLRRQIQERWFCPTVENTINKIILGQRYSFELYKSLNNKKDLLKCAVKSSDGNAILAVVVYLAKTLKKSLFYQLLMVHPTAVSHYVYYLYTRRQMADLNDLLEALGRTKDFTMKQLNVASQNPQRLQQRLRVLLKSYSLETWDHQVIQNYSKLIEWQTAASKVTMDPSIIGQSAVQSLKYCNLHKLSIPFENVDNQTESQTTNFIKYFGISDKQSLVILVRTNAEMKKWNIIEELLIVKGWLGSKKLSTNLPIERLLQELQKQGAPTTLIDNILTFVADAEKRIEIANKLRRHSVVIEIYNKRKDKPGLLKYMATLDCKSEDYVYAESILQSMLR